MRKSYFSLNPQSNSCDTEFLLVDIPGLNDDPEKDIEHIKEMIDHIKGLKYCNLFIIVIDGNNARFDESTRQHIQVY